ncbi:hypothetical protein F5X68DRAFT_274999 [Plectosphaerella plurivora]|uniref:Uncharacterized protein n=1 Tax=Plectosphaerella plurivora TaxID=936078 RepID=A0A9P8VDZ2_9PEZI|nr:hypothetical protein F5X68DRAFT_274999 [Plectosphaerella plurivora]
MDGKKEEQRQASAPGSPQDQQTQDDAQVHHQTRESGTNWAEFDVNAAPQVAVYDAPETMAPPGVDVEADGHRRSSSDEKFTPVVVTPWWVKNRTIILTVLFILIASIVIPVAVTQTAGRAGENDTSDPTSSTVASSVSESSTATSTSRRPDSTSSVIPECDTSDFVRGVNWIGSSVPNWSFKLDLADDAVDCCEQCYQDKGCNGWMFMADDASNVPPCNRILGHDGPNEDDECPNGKPDIVFAKGSNALDNFGGGGPCAGRVRS